MPPKSANNKPYFFYGHRKPTQHRPTVRGGLFSNRQIINPSLTTKNSPSSDDFQLQKWDPDGVSGQRSRDPSQEFFSLAQRLSPIARYIVDSFRKHGKWGKPLVADLNSLRRVTPKLVAEVLKHPNLDPKISSNFFYWAGISKLLPFYLSGILFLLSIVCFILFPFFGK